MNACLVFAALVVAAPALKEPKKESPLVGRWRCQELVSGGQPSPGNTGLEYEFTADGKWLISPEAPGPGPIDRTFTLVDAGNSNDVDLKGETNSYHGLFKVEKDTLTLIWRHVRFGRPTGFDDIDGTTRFTMTRVKK